MARKHKREEIIAKLREAEIVLAQGGTVAKGVHQHKLLSPARRRRCIDHIRSMMRVSERRICFVLERHQSTQRKTPRGAEDEAALTEDIITLARQ